MMFPEEFFVYTQQYELTFVSIFLNNTELQLQ